MPVVSGISAIVGYGRAQRATAGPVPGTVPAYYTSNSGYILYSNQVGTSATLIDSVNITTGSPVIRTYTGIQGNIWNIVQDKDSDSNVYYGIPDSSPYSTMYKITIPKGGGAVTNTSLGTFSPAPTSEVLGACYAPACMWTGTGYGAVLIGGYNQGVIHVIELNSTKTGYGTKYQVTWSATPNPEIYGVEVVPKLASGFNNNYGLAYTRNGGSARTMTSWTVNMDTRSWTNQATPTAYTTGTTGPSNGLGMIYYPIGKRIFTGDPDTSTNRIAMFDTSTAKLYVWTITESGTSIVWTYLKQVTTRGNGYMPYHLSTAAYNAIS
jgi:hypothetical protein